jgi:hypothetical protein
VDELARAAIDQRQHGRDRGMRRRSKRQRLHQLIIERNCSVVAVLATWAPCWFWIT